MKKKHVRNLFQFTKRQRRIAKVELLNAKILK